MNVLLLPGVNPATIDRMNRLTGKLPLDGADIVLNGYRFCKEHDDDAGPPSTKRT